MTRIIESTHWDDQLPFRKEGVDGLWQLDSHNDWFAKLTRKGDVLHGEMRVEYDTLEIMNRYRLDALEALKPWLDYRYGRFE